MKKLVIAGFCIALLVMSGCKSAPEEVVETPPEVVETPTETPAETTDDSLANANEALMADIIKAREMAIAAGAEQYFANELMVIDVASTEVHTVYEDGGDETAFSEAATDILYQYRALEQAALAAKAEAMIAKMGYDSYDVDSYSEGNTASETAYELFNSGADGKSIYDEVKKAADAYNRVLFVAYSSLAEEERERFMTVKAQADEIKAGVADPQNYAGAVVFFTQGDADVISENPESAYKNFSIAADGMTTVFETVTEKRRIAQEAMDRARRRLEESDEVAAAADTIVPLADVEALDTVSDEEQAETTNVEEAE